ncbi:MAG: DUF177 domain-containing protein [Deltaproteobacteria bacterium]|nr:DUF177 domain-containing protein [Deltaproteobacteria bacterium]
MLIQLDRIRDQPLEWEETLEIAPEFLADAGLVALSAPRWQGRCDFTDPGHYLSGSLDYRQTLACGRCLGEVEEAISTAVNLLIISRPGKPEEEEQQLDEQDLNVVHLVGEELDTAPIFLEQMQLNVPMKPLCREDCQGLCPHCGENRNKVSCSCESQVVDPRWAALKGLRGTLGND